MRTLSVSLALVATVLVGCTDGPSDPTDDGDFVIGKMDGQECVESTESDDARGLLAYANDGAVTAHELRELGIYTHAAANIVSERPFASLAELDAVPNVGQASCRALRAHACDVRGLCEAKLPMWTWNVRMFPLSTSTVDHVAATLEQVEVVGLQEVDSLDAFDQVIAKLPGWVGVPGKYGFGTQVAIAFNTERLKLVSTEDLFPDDPDRFPRPVLAATFEITGRVGSARFTVLDVHLKAQVDADSQRRRTEAIVMLDQWMDARRAAGERVIALGDWNDDIDDAPTANVFTPLLGTDAYVTPTLAIAEQDGYSYIPYKRLLDHVVLTKEAAETLTIDEVAPVALETTIPDYTRTVSDHRPVRATLIPVLPR